MPTPADATGGIVARVYYWCCMRHNTTTPSTVQTPNIGATRTDAERRAASRPGMSYLRISRRSSYAARTEPERVAGAVQVPNALPAGRRASDPAAGAREAAGGVGLVTAPTPVPTRAPACVPLSARRPVPTRPAPLQWPRQSGPPDSPALHCPVRRPGADAPPGAAASAAGGWSRRGV